MQIPRTTLKTPASNINMMSPQPPKTLRPSRKSKEMDRGKIMISTFHRAGPQTSPKAVPLSKPAHKASTLLSPANSNVKKSVASSQLFGSPVSVSTTGAKSKKPQPAPAKENVKASSPSDIIVASRFRLIKKIGKGSFGVAYESVDLLTNERIAIKLERKREDRKSKSAALVNTREIAILERLDKCARVPTLIWHGQYKQYRVMAIELQGLNLSDLNEVCGRQFSLKTVIYILVECLYCMQDIHAKGIVHRDIKPQNFIINRDPASNKLHVIDFGLSSWFETAQGSHIAYNDQCSPVGTARYASIANHRGIHQTRRDDLESIGYMVIFFLKNELPWQGVKEPRRVKKWRKIQHKKQSTSTLELTQGLPNEFAFYLEYVKKLKYDEAPDYAKLIRVFKQLYKRKGYYAKDMLTNGATQQQLDQAEADGSDAELKWNIADVIIPDWIHCETPST